MPWPWQRSGEAYPVVSLFVEACRAYKDVNGKLPPNLTLFFEGEEESEMSVVDSSHSDEVESDDSEEGEEGDAKGAGIPKHYFPFSLLVRYKGW